MKRKLILASASPRRKELLSLLGYEFECIPATKEEEIDLSLPLTKAIEKVAKAKAQDVYDSHTDFLVLGSDTIVTIDGMILGKPKNDEDAFRMLRLLSGKTHEVITGLAFISQEETFITHEVTKVKFMALNDEEINNYLLTKEPNDKAGAYALQGKGGAFIEKIDGDVYTVIGLPLNKVYTYLSNLK